MKNAISSFKNNRLFRLIGLIAVFFVINIFAKQIITDDKKNIPEFQQKQSNPQSVAEEMKKNQPNEANVTNKRGILIFLDDPEKDELGAISYGLLQALYQEAGSIIVSASLLYTLFEHRLKDNRSVETIFDEIQKDREKVLEIIDPNAKKSKQDVVQQKHDIIMSKLAFQADRWIIKKINSSLCLLLPTNHLQSLHVNIDKAREYTSGRKVSDIELQLGLKINHMETLDYQSMSRSLYARILNYFFKITPFSTGLANYFINSLNSIFCEKTAYKEKVDIPEWCIFIDGHGLINHSIAHLSFHDFKQFLQFLDKEINTQLLVVSSCYVAGVNAETIYGDIKSETQQYYSFPIVIQGFNDVITHSVIPSLTKYTYNDKQTIGLTNDLRFDSFFKNARELVTHYSDIVRPITPYFLQNTPQIKLPGIEWFSVMDLDKKIVSIGSILAKTRDAEKPLDIVTFFKKDPEIILLYTDNIPFELKINSHNTRAIVSMVASSFEKEDSVRTVYEMEEFPGKSLLFKVDRWLIRKAKIMASTVSSRLKLKDRVQTIHRIKKISSTTHGFSQILLWFSLVRSSEGHTWFLIDEMVDKDGISIEDVLIVGRTHPEPALVYFKDKDNVLFKMVLYGAPAEKIKQRSVDENFYNERINIIRNEYPKLSEKMQRSRGRISSEQIKNLENMLFKQREKQKTLAPKNSPLIQ